MAGNKASIHNFGVAVGEGSWEEPVNESKCGSRTYLERHEALGQVFLEVGVAGGGQLEGEVGEVAKGVGLHHAHHRDSPVRWRLGEVEQEPAWEWTNHTVR